MFSENQLKNAAKEVIESGAVDNAKPIYCHPIYCSYNRRDDSKIICFTCLIFNNDKNAFTKSSFYQWCKDLFAEYPTASILASGFAGVAPISRILNGTSFEELRVQTSKTDTTSEEYSIYKTDIENESTAFIDGVNKIN